jgi:hypothetical protein
MPSPWQDCMDGASCMSKPAIRARRPIPMLAVLAAIVMSSLAAAQGPSPEIVAPASRDVTPPGITPAPSGSGPLIREPIPPAPAQPPRWRRFFLPKTTDAATFQTDNRTIRITDVVALAPETHCKLANGRAWPCGRTALHSLRMFLRGRAVECLFPRADPGTEIIAPCRVGETDLGLWLLSQGWAVPAEFASEEYKDASRAARCAKRGLWRGSQIDESCPNATRE